MLNVNMPIYIWQGAIGFQLNNESIGADEQTSLAISYNYIYESSIGLFSTGIRAGLQQLSIDGTKLRAPDGVYEGSIVDHQDVHLPNSKVSGVAPLLEAGFYFAGNEFEAGLSMTGYYPGGLKVGDEITYDPKPGFHFLENTSSNLSKRFPFIRLFT